MPTAPPGRMADRATASNRRLYPRRKSTFPATYYAHDRQPRPAYGLDISGGGLCLLTKEPIPEETLGGLVLLAMIDGRKVQFEASGRWAEPIDVRGATHYRYGMKLRTISDGDWDFIMKLSTDETAAGITPGSILSPSQRDAILPVEKQKRIATTLAQRNRLQYVDDGRPPLIEYSFEGYAMQHGTPFYRLTVRSRMPQFDHTMKDYRTTVLVSIEGHAVKILD